VVDMWADVFRGNPNDQVHVRSNFNQYKKLVRKYKCSVLLLHHNVKNSESAQPDKRLSNGSVAIEGSARCVIELRGYEGNDDDRLITIVKGNYVSPEMKKKGLVITYDRHSMVFTTTGRQITISSLGGGGQKYNR